LWSNFLSIAHNAAVNIDKKRTNSDDFDLAIVVKLITLSNPKKSFSHRLLIIKKLTNKDL